MASNGGVTWTDYYNDLDVPSMLIGFVLLIIFLFFVVFISIELVTRRDFTVMRKTMWTVSFAAMPGLSQLFYLFFGERYNIDSYGDFIGVEE